MPVEKKDRDAPEKEPAWTFGSEGDYAVDPYQRAERIAAVSVALLWTGLVCYRSGFGYSIRTAASYLIPVACIWWPDAMRSWPNGIPPLQPHTYSNRPRPTHVRVCGWLWLSFPALAWIFRELVQAPA